MNRIDTMFAARRAENQSALILFLTVGHPDYATTEAAIDAMVAGGVDLIELGIPFSDPLADGPTIQRSSVCALEAGTTIEGIFEMVKRVRAKHPDLALLLFTAFNPVSHYGVDAFAETALSCGVDGLLIPDLPPEEAGEALEATARREMSLVFLVAPTTSPERARMIAETSSGFVYYVSLKGVTGARAELPEDVTEKISALRAETDKPVAVGFGVSRPEQARGLAKVSDGVIVGSALVKLIDELAGKPEFSERIEAFTRELAEAVHCSHD